MASPAPQTLSQQAPEAWSPSRRILFRFLCSYFLLYSLPTTGRISIFESFPYGEVMFGWYVAIWRAICPWVASHVFHLSGKVITYFPTGSGDTTLSYIENLMFVVVALAAALLWSVLDRRRRGYRRLDPWLQLLVRYTLAFTLFGYGFAKIFPLQFRPPNLQRLIEPYGDFSPMGALWWFMGASVPYIIFAGAAEVSGALLLLLFRRTATLGSLVAFGVLLNVMMLNYCYDVPVKLYSSNLVLMALYLASGDLRRLVDFFVRNRATTAVDQTGPRFSRRWARVSALVFQVLFVGYTLFGSIYGGWQGYQASYVHPQQPPIYGLYEVEQFARNGREVPALVTDGTRWRKVIAEFPGFVTVKMMDGSLRGYQAKYDAAKNGVTLSAPNDRRKYSLQYGRPDAGHLTIEGTLAGDRVSMRLRKIDTSSFLLVNRGFHWINEVPLNR